MVDGHRGPNGVAVVPPAAWAFRDETVAAPIRIQNQMATRVLTIMEMSGHALIELAKVLYN